MKKLSDLSTSERSLLLYFESCSVDYGGRMDNKRINKEDFEIWLKWIKEKFVIGGRICFKDINSQGAHWVELSKNAWKLAHEERIARFERLNKKRSWKRTEEKNEVLALIVP